MPKSCVRVRLHLEVARPEYLRRGSWRCPVLLLERDDHAGLCRRIEWELAARVNALYFQSSNRFSKGHMLRFVLRSWGLEPQ